MKIDKVYFDMDGVLADFNRGVTELCGLPAIPQGNQSDAETDSLFEAMAKVQHYYGKLKPIEGAIEMFKKVHEEFGDKCEILTGIPKPMRKIYDAKDDKIKWAAELLGPEVVVNTCLRADKNKFCTGKGCILIDDYDLNIREWEKAGGTGILFENPEAALEALEKLKKA